MTATVLPLTRRALSAWGRWREKSGLDRRNWERACELTDPEVRALEQLRENAAKCGKPSTWFEHSDTHGPRADRKKIAQLVAGLQLREADLPAFVALWPLMHPGQETWLETGIRKHLEPQWKQARAQDEAQELRRAEERERAAAVRRDAERRAQEERQRIAREEWERKQQALAAAAAEETTMETATLNGKHTETPARKPDFVNDPKLRDLTRAEQIRLWLNWKGIVGFDEVTPDVRREIAKDLGSTSDSIYQTIRAIQRAEAEQRPQPAPKAEAVDISTERVDAEAPESAQTESVAEQVSPLLVENDDLRRKLEDLTRELAQERDRHTMALLRGDEVEKRLIAERDAHVEAREHNAELAARVAQVSAAQADEEATDQPYRLTMADRRIALDLAAGGEHTENPERYAEILRLAREAVLAVLR